MCATPCIHVYYTCLHSLLNSTYSTHFGFNPLFASYPTSHTHQLHVLIKYSPELTAIIFCTTLWIKGGPVKEKLPRKSKMLVLVGCNSSMSVNVVVRRTSLLCDQGNASKDDDVWALTSKWLQQTLKMVAQLYRQLCSLQMGRRYGRLLAVQLVQAGLYGGIRQVICFYTYTRLCMVDDHSVPLLPFT